MGTLVLAPSSRPIMDVTAMLNTSGAAKRAEQEGSSGPTPTQSVIDGSTACSSIVPTPSPEKTPPRRTCESRASNRSRTPWDAGGYSLGLTLDIKSTQQPNVQMTAIQGESPVDTASPESLRHKFSDSHSSLSSYTSSANSASHSRFSSMSTVSGFQIGAGLSDMVTLDASCDNLDSAVSRMSVMDNTRRASNRDGGGFSPSGMGSDDPTSGIQGADRMSEQDMTKDFRPDLSYLAPPDLSKVHKRALSAPDFAAIGAIDQIFPSLPQTFQPTPPPSHQGDIRSSYNMDALSASPVDNTVASTSSDIKCMYMDNCDTGSQPRKAISHIFGRNKLCTRMIPQHVWVHFCRKHYQRSRYRNAQEWAKIQCELVQKQIQRVQSWSDDNKRAGQSGVVQDWSLSVRKREQKRLDDKGTSGKKRPYRDESDDDDETIDRAVLNGTAVPAWLLSKCGSGYATEQIEEIVAHLKSEMDQNRLTQIPDIEILPNISTDMPEDGKSKVVVKRKTSNANSHKRSQSVGVPLPPPMTRRSSQQNYYDALHTSPIDKRQRVTEFGSYGERRPSIGLAQVPERAVPTMGRMHHQLPHRPAFANIRETQTEDSFYEEDDGRNAHYSLGGPLPTPSAVRQPMQAMTNQMEPSRPIHQRSQSEMGTCQHNNSNFTFRSPSTVSYPTMPQNYPDPTAYDNTYLRNDGGFGSTTGPPGYYDDMPMNRQYQTQQLWASPAQAPTSAYGSVRHSRHQSTSAVPQLVPRSSPSDMHASGVRNTSFDNSQLGHNRMQSMSMYNTRR
ncbi:uncharacterized protein PG986_008022 [Apiospora aurea]|uniref:ORP1 like protein n=1 Tax=Apiospora aurea TaxID=335848 RepID=A0ABR1QE91_9PEZI